MLKKKEQEYAETEERHKKLVKDQMEAHIVKEKANRFMEK